MNLFINSLNFTVDFFNLGCGGNFIFFKISENFTILNCLQAYGSRILKDLYIDFLCCVLQ